ncbi:MAG: dTDP-4-dehydrorhamnose 3,5-epimerase [Pseudomonadota bacterium]|jgi:dTDP-4-dehydrorhamnose 3,5-epimerase
MNIITTPINGLLLLEPKVFHDARGWFSESFNQQVFNNAIGNNPATNTPYEFVQDNHSFSHQGVLRGLHYQLPPFAQGKLVRVVQGAVWDVAVDIRKDSITFGRWFGIELSATNSKQLWIPPGFAHGFITLSESAQFLYKTTALYNKDSEGAIVWNDPDINIAWPKIEGDVIVSEKDANNWLLKQLVKNNLFL